MQDVKIRLLEKDSSRRDIGPSERPPSDNTQHSQQTGIHVTDGNRTYNPSKQAAVDPKPYTARLLEPVKNVYTTRYLRKTRESFTLKCVTTLLSGFLLWSSRTLPEGTTSTFLRKYVTFIPTYTVL